MPVYGKDRARALRAIGRVHRLIIFVDFGIAGMDAARSARVAVTVRKSLHTHLLEKFVIAREGAEDFDRRRQLFVLAEMPLRDRARRARR